MSKRHPRGRLLALWLHQLVYQRVSMVFHGNVSINFTKMATRTPRIPRPEKELQSRLCCWDCRTLAQHAAELNWWFQPLWKIWVRQLGWLFPIYGKIKNVPLHQPETRQTGHFSLVLSQTRVPSRRLHRSRSIQQKNELLAEPRCKIQGLNGLV
jgi:hypothetical protein